MTENLTLPQLFEKYPHLASLQYEEIREESSLSEERKKKQQLLFD
jgi:hypothetical protein